mmetsp:Transcript_8654/g.24867  ORF Transcript_8654/g.24867 Transcript_8654/m.24867 type:complete len:382 (-) Transcript_8654:149-1294(-)
MQRLEKHEGHRAVILRRNEVSDQRLSQGLLLREGRQLRQLLVPLRHAALRVDAENWGVCCLDEPREIIGDALGLGHEPVQRGDVLTHADDADALADGVAPGRGIEQHRVPLAELGQQGQLVVCRLLAAERLLEDLRDAQAVLWLDELFHQILADCLLLGVAQHLRGLPVPLGNETVAIDAENGSIRVVDEARQVVRHTLLFLGDLADLGDVLTHANDARHLVVRPSSRGGIDKHLLPRASFREQSNLEVRRLLAHQGQGQDFVHWLLEFQRDERGDEVLFQGLILAETEQARRGRIPFVHLPPRINAEYRSIRGLDEPHEALGDPLGLRNDLLQLADVLPHSDNACDLSVVVAARCRVKEHGIALAAFGEERQLVVRRLHA